MRKVFAEIETYDKASSSLEFQFFLEILIK